MILKKTIGRISANTPYIQAIRYYRTKDWSNAERFFRRAVELNPRHADAHFKVGMCRFRKKDWEEALVWIERALEIAPYRERWKMQRDQALRHLGRPAAASSGLEEQALRGLIERGKKGAKIYDRLAQTLRKQGKWWQEIDALNMAIARSPSRADFHFRLGEALEAMNRFQQAGAAYQEALRRAPRNAEWAYKMAYAYEREGFDGPANTEFATEGYRLAIEFDESEGSKEFGIGVFHQRSGNWAAAAAAYTRQLKNDPTNAELLYRAGLSYDRCYEWPTAETMIRRSLAFSPDHPHRYARLGFVLERQNQYIDAAAAYSRAIAIGGKDIKTWFYRQGLSLMQAREYERAAYSFLKAGTTNIDNSEQTPDLAEIRLAEREIAILEEALDHDATPADVHFCLAAAYGRANQWPATARSYEAAILRQNDFNPTWFLNWGKALLRCGKFEEACFAFRSTRLIGSAYGGISESRLKSDPHFRRRVLYSEFYETLPLRNKTILYESFNGRSMSCNPLAIFEYLLKKEEFSDWHHIWVLNNIKDVPKRFLNIRNISFIEYQSDAYLRALVESEFLINNATFPTYFIRREGQKYLNTWHGTPIKFMGKDIKGEFFSHTNTARNFLQASHLVTPNRHTTDVLIKRYDIESLFSGIVSETGYPRIDLTLNASEVEKSALRKRLGIESGKKVILYAPTWRGTWNEASFDKGRLLDDLKAMERPDCHTLFRGHYQVEQTLEELSANSMVVPNEIDTNTLLSIVDILITDYSSIAIDFISCEKPIIFYAYDIDEYEKDRGFYFPLSDLPGELCHERRELPSALSRSLSGINLPEFKLAKQRFCPHEDGNSSKRISDIFLGTSNENNHIGEKNEKNKLVFYGGSILPNGITNSFINLINKLNKDDFSISALIDPSSLADHADRNQLLQRIPSNIDVIGKVGARTFTLEEEWVSGKLSSFHNLYSKPMWKILEKGYQREFRRTLGPAKADCLVNFDGYTRHFLYMLAFAPQSAAKKKVLYQHNDMLGEWRERFPYLEASFRIYNDFDTLVSVSPTLRDLNQEHLAKRFSIPAEKFAFAENVHNPEYVLAAAEAEIGDPNELKIIDEADPLFITMGRMSVEKDQEKLIRAFKNVCSKHPRARLIILGDGPLRQHLLHVIAQLKLDKKIFLFGQRSNPFPYLKRADCFVLPSNHEGQPMVLLEALILGKPIIATDIAGNRGALDGKPGTLVENSVEGLASGMLDFIRQPQPTVDFDIATYQAGALSAFHRIISAEDTYSEAQTQPRIEV